MERKLRRYRSDRDLRRCGVYDAAGGYRSQWYRGIDSGMEWLRLSLEGPVRARVRVYAADRPPELWDETQTPVLVRDAADLCLYGVRGLWLCFTVTPAEGLRGYSLTFPGRSIDGGLPFVLRDDLTLRRFLAVYQSAYMDANQEAARFPGRLDPRAADPLPDLSLWVGAALWMRDTPCMPELLAAAPRLNRMRGTRRGLEWLVRLATGGRGELVEEFQWREQPLNRDEQTDCARLYGGGHAGVVLLLPADTGAAQLRFLESVLDDFIPLGITCSILRLQNGAELDGHFYLDVNTQLQEPPPAELDTAELDDLVLG